MTIEPAQFVTAMRTPARPMADVSRTPLSDADRARTVKGARAVLASVRSGNGDIIDFRVVEWNVAPYGPDRAESVGSTLSRLPVDHHLLGVVRLLRRVVESGEELLLEDFATTVGRPARLDIRMTPIGDGVVVEWRDVTARFERHTALKSREESMSRIVSGSPMGIATTDPEGRFTDANPAYCRLLGRDHDWLLAHTMSHVLFPGDDAVYRDFLESLGSSPQRHVSMTQTFVTASGAPVTGHHTVAQLWEAGAPAGTVSYVIPTESEPEAFDRSWPTVVVVSDDSAGLWGDAVSSLLEHRPDLRIMSPATMSGLPVRLMEAPPDVLVVLVSGGKRGRDQCAQLLEDLGDHPDIGLVLLSASAADGMVDMLRTRTGATAFLPVLEVSDVGVVSRAVDAVARGATVLDPKSISRLLGPKEPSGSRVDQLSERELEVLELMANGWDNHVIAERLCVSVKAVENYVGTVFRKLRLNDESGINRRVRAALMFRGEM